MQKYLIEVPHESNELACAKVIRTFLSTGSHYLTNADWGCEDGDHKAWLVVEAANPEEARWVVPPAFRASARVVRLSRFSMRDVDDILAQHSAP
jgi:hypothetical protein